MSAHSVLYVYEGFSNPGDCYSYCGARHYINEIGVACEHSLSLRTTRDLPDQLSLSGPDLVVLAGAPWFWDSCVKSEKYAAAYALLKSVPGAAKLAVGVGSCYMQDYTMPVVEKAVMADREALKQFWSLFDNIIVRDVLAWKVLDMIGVKAQIAPCPSVAVGEWYGTLKDRSGSVVLSEPLVKNFIYSYIPEKERAFYSDTCRRLISGGASSVEWVTGDRAARAGRSVKSMCRDIDKSGAAAFFTARVHAALVASGLGLQGELQAFDSRSLSAKLHGVKLVGGLSEVFTETGDKAGRDAPAAAGTRDAVTRAMKEIL